MPPRSSLRSRIADVATDDHQLRKSSATSSMYGIGRKPVSDGRNGRCGRPGYRTAPRVRRTRRTAGSNADRSAAAPQPRHHPQSDESVVAHPSAQFTNGRHRLIEVDRRQSAEESRFRLDRTPLGHFVRYQVKAVRAPPVTEQTERPLRRRPSTASVSSMGRSSARHPAAGQRRRGRQHVTGEAPRRVLHPDIDCHRGRLYAGTSGTACVQHTGSRPLRNNYRHG